MKLRQLRYFIAVADAQSITAASRKLHVVQSAVSHQIANLEQELGVQLFERSKSGVRLTAGGQLVYRHALAVAKHIEAATEEVRHVDKDVHGKVAVGLPHSTADVLALPLLKTVREQLPHVVISLHEGLSGVLGEQLASGQLDFSILFDTEPRRGFQATPLVAERLHFVSASAELLRAHSSSREISLQAVLQRPLILPPQPNGIRVLIEREALRADLKPHVIADITGVQTMLAAVKDGIADTVMMAANAPVTHAGQRLLVLPVGPPFIARTAALFEPSHFTLTTAAARVKEITLNLVSELVSQGAWPGGELLIDVEPAAAG